MPLSKETQFKDISGNSNDGTNNGSRIDGYCAGFVTSSIQIPTTTTLDPGTGDFTYMCSFRSSNTTNDCRFYYSNWANNNSFIIWYRGSDVIEIGIKDNDGTQVGGDVTDNNNYMDGLWHGLTITFDRDGVVTGYIDGVKQTTTVDISSANADITTNSDISISSTNVSWGVDGDIKNVRIYNRVLPPSEITQLYENTKPYEIQLFNKEAVINNQQDYPQYWRKEINSPKQDYTNEAPTYWNISSASGEFNIDSIFTFSAENVWRRLFTEENYNSIGNLASIENAITYNSNRTNAEIATIATFFDNTTTSASIAEWLNRKEAIVTYDGEFGVFSNGYIATQSEAVNEWMDVSTENWHNLYPHTGSVIMSSSTLVFDASSSLKLMDDTYITDNYAMTSSWTIVATYTPQTSSGDMGLLYINGDVSIGVDILYKGGNYELAATVNPDSSSLNRLWTTLTNNIENVFVLTWDSGSYDCNFYNKSSNVWNSSSLNITSINHIDNTGSVSFNDGYSGSISEIRIYDSIKNFEQF